jgi:hypothetical protein
MATERIIYNGKTYSRNPESPNWADRVYFRCGPNSGERYLHRQKWIDAHGPIPEGCDIHHKDENPLNNDIPNLESLPDGVHQRQHGASMPDWKREWLRTHADEIRDSARAWHSSPEGRAWHRLHGIQAWENRQPHPRECEYCGQTYSTIGTTGKFCSNRCKSAHRRKLGVDDISRACARCGKVFTVNRYADTETCSRVCSQQLRRSRERSSI